MKPRTKLQKRVASLAPLLPEITYSQKQYALKHCFDHLGYRTKRQTVCMSCLHYFQTDKKRCKCPSCGSSLEICDTKKQIHRSERYFCIVTTYMEFQVLRFFYFEKISKVGGEIKIDYIECVQHWITPGGEYVTRAILTGSFGRSWCWKSDLEIRLRKNIYQINPDAVWRQKKIIPMLKRNGFKGNFHNIIPIDLFTKLLTDNNVEILFKAGQIALLKHYVTNSYRQSGFLYYWKSIKICIRNDYKVSDTTMWFDLIDDFVYLKKDILNPKYICPGDLLAAHTHYNLKRRELEKKIELEEQKKRIDEAQIEYEKQKKRYFGVKFGSGDIQVAVLDHVREFAIEGDIHQHCVFTNEYYRQKNSLILSARKGEKRVATIEVDLKKCSIVQCRGFQNKQPEEYESILSLVNKNMQVIRKLKRVKAA